MSASWWIPLENALGMLRENFFGESQILFENILQKPTVFKCF